MHLLGRLYRRWHHVPAAADALALAAIASIPWSTSLTSVLIVVWLIAVLPGLDWPSLRHSLISVPGGPPVVLVGIAVVGMLWADVSIAERWSGLRPFLKLLIIPVLLAQFKQSANGNRAIIGFLISCIVVLGLSMSSAIWPSITWWRPGNPGVPFKNQITQSAEFTICAFCLIPVAITAYRTGHYTRGTSLFILSALFLVDVAFVATSRSELVVIATLITLSSVRALNWKGVPIALGLITVLSAVAWYSSPYLQGRLRHGNWEIERYITEDRATSIGLRMDWWTHSLEFWKAAPLIGYGTGSIKSVFRRNTDQQTTRDPQFVTTDPHNQTINVALQLGLIGVAALFAMWAAHFQLFRYSGLIAWFGSVVVVQNIIGSVFNSHLSNFTEGWIYVFGVGVLGGMIQRIDGRISINGNRVTALGRRHCTCT